MIVRSLGVQNYRNIADGLLEASPAVNVIYGENAQGKTNLLEALWLFTGGRSFRGAKDAELVRLGSSARWPLFAFTAGNGSRKPKFPYRTGGGLQN